jgi:transcriptional regulator with XRE-family HTH domain
MDDAANRIGRFLRARRELVRPEHVGIPDLGRRRVPGLRREELAMLAGVSADYYVRLEQGRDQHPSEQVLDALARALRLDDDATAHLHELARPAPGRRRRAGGRGRLERVRPSLQRLMDAWAESPAHVLGCRMDVLAANPMALVLNPAQRVGTNVVRSMFLDPEFQALHPNFERAAAGTVASLRAQVGPDLDDPLLHELVGELSLKSEVFRKLWARHEVHAKTHGTKHMVHPIVGELELDYESFSVNGADGQMLIVYHAQPGSASARALALLSSMVAVSPRDGSRRLPPSDRAPEPGRPGPTAA